MTDEETTTLFMNGGTVLRSDSVVLICRRNGGSNTPESWLVYLEGTKRYDIPLPSEDYFVGIVSLDDDVFALAKEGRICRFSIPVGATPQQIESSRKDWVIEEVDEFGALIRIRRIGSGLFCCGQCGQVYRLDKQKWVPYDHGIRSDDALDFEDIGGSGPDDLYGVGLFGEMHHFDGKTWNEIDVPTNQNLLCVKQTSPGTIYVAGYEALIMRGSLNNWEIIGKAEEDKHYWDIGTLGDMIFFVYGQGIDYLDGDDVIPVDFKIKGKLSFHRVDTNQGQLWSIGEYHLLKFDGKNWTLVVDLPQRK
jgi:hypothetical protein